MEDIRSIARGTIVALQIYRFKIYLPATMYTRVAEKAMETYEHPGQRVYDLLLKVVRGCRLIKVPKASHFCASHQLDLFLKR
jgi:hypothetical protein